MKDYNWISYYGHNPDTAGFSNPPKPKEYDDIMKFSGCSNAFVYNLYVTAGRENCIDAVRGTDYIWSCVRTEDGAGVAAFTIKGAIDGWAILGSTIGHGKETDIEVGQFDIHWYPGRAPTRNGVIDACKSTDGKPIRVTLWNAEKPKVTQSSVKIRRIPWIIWFPYFLYRYIKTKK